MLSGQSVLFQETEVGEDDLGDVQKEQGSQTCEE